MAWHFYTANGLALLCWALLIFAPQARLTGRVAGGLWPLLILSAYYVANLVATLLQQPASLPAFFALPTGLYAGWTHYLVLDLFAGQLIYRRARRYNGWYVTNQVITLVVAPLGVVMFLLGRRN